MTCISETNNGFMSRFQVSHLKPDWPPIEEVNAYNGDDTLDEIIPKAFLELFELHMDSDR